MAKYFEEIKGKFFFFDSSIHVVPETAKRISDELYNEVMRDRPAGKVLAVDTNGMPCLVDPAGPTLDDLKAAKNKGINVECDRLINAAVLSYPDTEVLTFPKQETEARAYLAYPASPTPMIDALSVNRGIDKTELVNRIIAKADYFAGYTGKIVGHRQKLEDQVNAAITPEDLAAIDPLVGWPE